MERYLGSKMDNKNNKIQELEAEQLEKVSGGQKAVIGTSPEPDSPVQPYEIEDAPDDIGLPKF